MGVAHIRTSNRRACQDAPGHALRHSDAFPPPCKATAYVDVLDAGRTVRQSMIVRQIEHSGLFYRLYILLVTTSLPQARDPKAHLGMRVCWYLRLR